VKVYLIVAVLVVGQISQAVDFNLPYNRQRVVNALWKSPLGKQFFIYMTKRLDNVQIIEEAQHLTDYVFSDEGIWVNRLSAVQIMTESLYRSDLLLDNDKIRRLVLLQGNIWQIESDIQVEYPGRGLAKLAAIEAIIGLFAGSPAIRESLLQSGKNLLNKIKLKKYIPSCRSAFSGLNVKKMTTNYSMRDAFKSYVWMLGPTSGFYLFWFDLDRSLRANSIPEMIAETHSEEAFEKLLENLQKL